jgi:hypothetical protein
LSLDFANFRTGRSNLNLCGDSQSTDSKLIVKDLFALGQDVNHSLTMDILYAECDALDINMYAVVLGFTGNGFFQDCYVLQ